MKKLLIISAIAVFITSGCEDFLEEDSRSNVVAEEFYTTPLGYESLINANYSQLREIYGQDPWLFMAGTDLYTEGRDPEPMGLSQYSELNSASQGVDFLYSKCYEAIQSANLALYYGDLTEETSTLTNRIGEARYLRANAYFLLVQTYGNVSLVTEPTDEPINSYGQTEASVIYDFILSELEEASPMTSSGSYVGRVTERAVNHLRALVHLTRAYEPFAANDDFTVAAQLADQVIGGQSLTTPFDQLWEPGNEMNEEIIFSVQYDASSINTAPTKLGHQQQNFFGSYLGGSEVAGDAPYKTYNLLATRFALDLFTEEDARWGVTFMTEVYERYYDYFDVEDKSSLAVAHFYEPSWYTSADSTAYVAAHPGVTYHPYGLYDPEGGDISDNYNMIVTKKFDDPSSLYASGDEDRRVSSRDFIVARLAETYLLAAEAYLGAGDPGTALLRLNEVRNRAGVADVTAIDLDVILDERALELFGEYKRWFDLKRTGKLVERASLHHPLIEEANFAGSNGVLKLLRPIPQTALDLNQNKNFEQNPAYQ